jgi:peptidoglycan/LPS O-acetylase OafA/YrhL
MLWVVIAGSLVLGLFLLSASELRRLGASAAAAASAVSNICFWVTGDYFSQDARLDPLLMTWSLGIEEQFYLFFPLLLLAISRWRPAVQLAGLFMIAAGSLALSIGLTPKAPQASFYLLPTRAWELGSGILLAVWQAQGRPALSRMWSEAASVAGLLALGVSIVAFETDTPFPGIAALLPALGALALIGSGDSFINTRLLAHPLPVGIGLVSYSWYLWHWPLMAFARISTVGPPSVSVLALLALIALFLATLSWRFIESPFRRRSPTGGLALFLYALAGAGLVSASLAIVLADGIPWRQRPETTAIEQAVRTVHEARCISHASTPNMSAGCIPPAAGRNLVVVMGDSHAAALAPGLQELARQHGWVAQIFAKPSCRPLLGVTVWRADQPSLAPNCLRFMDQALTRVAADPSVQTVLLVGQWSGPIVNPDQQEHYAGRDEADVVTPKTTLFEEGLGGAADLLSRSGKTVFIAGDVPFWPFDAGRSALIQSISFRGWLEEILEPRSPSRGGLGLPALRDDKVDDLVAKTARKIGVQYIDLAAGFCPDGICRYEADRTLFFADAHHVTYEGALRALEPWAAMFFNPTAPPGIYR